MLIMFRCLCRDAMHDVSAGCSYKMVQYTLDIAAQKRHAWRLYSRL